MEQNQEQDPVEPKPNPYHTDKRDVLRAYGLISAIGMDLAACTVAGVFLGKWLDRLWGTSPWMLLLGIVVGLAGGIVGVVKILQTFGPEKRAK